MQEGFLGQVGAGRPRHAADRARRPGRLPELAARRVRLARRAAGPGARAATCCARRRSPRPRSPRAATTRSCAEQKKADFAALAGQMGDRYPYFQGKSGSRIGAGVLARGPGRVHRAVPAALQGAGARRDADAAAAGDDGARGRRGRRAQAGDPAGAAAGGGRGDRQHARRRARWPGLHALLVVSLFRPGSGVDLWLALLVTGVVTVVLWAVARPFRRLVSMVSLTREQFGGIVPGAGTRPDVAGVAAAARRRGRRPADPLVGGAARRGRGRRRLRRRAGPRPSPTCPRPGAGPRGHPRRRTEVEAPARPRASRPPAGRPCLPGADGVGDAARRLPRLGRSRRGRRPRDLPQARRRAVASGRRPPGAGRARRRRARSTASTGRARRSRRTARAAGTG